MVSTTFSIPSRISHLPILYFEWIFHLCMICNNVYRLFRKYFTGSLSYAALTVCGIFIMLFQNMTLVNITADLIKKKSLSLRKLTLMVVKANFLKFGFLLESLNLNIGNKYCLPCSDRLTSVNFLIQI